MRTYKCLDQHTFSAGGYAIVPIRDEDRYLIMQWRNEQIYHLRQQALLTKQNQNDYFDIVVKQLFEQEKPNQLLFSYLENDVCIGYGGLVHINWADNNAEISFVMDTKLEDEYFDFHWSQYLQLIEYVAFLNLGLHKIYTYAFNLRPHLYETLEKNNYQKEAVLKEHCYFENKYIDVLIHSKKTEHIAIRLAKENDAMQYFVWANSKMVRENAINTALIDLPTHLVWFAEKLRSPYSKLYYFSVNENPLGQVRFDKQNNLAVIDYSIDENYRGKGLGRKMLYMAMGNYLKLLDKDKKNIIFSARVKENNIASKKIFQQLGFKLKGNEIINNHNYYCFEK